jgi:hypothetical protein
MKLKLDSIIVERWKSGPNEGAFRPFELPDKAVIVKVSMLMERAIIYYTVPAR